MSDRIYASYWIETAFPLQQAAEIMAGEQSTGTFVRVPGETDELRERHAARVESIRECGAADSPSLPGAGLPKGVARGSVFSTCGFLPPFSTSIKDHSSGWQARAGSAAFSIAR